MHPQIALAMMFERDMIVIGCDHRLPADAALQCSFQHLAGFFCHCLSRSSSELPPHAASRRYSLPAYDSASSARSRPLTNFYPQNAQPKSSLSSKPLILTASLTRFEPRVGAVKGAGFLKITGRWDRPPRSQLRIRPSPVPSRGECRIVPRPPA